jgi:hypothetical protein
MDGNLVESAVDVSYIAFGFMASKALFAGLHIHVFTLLAGGGKSSKEIADEALSSRWADQVGKRADRIAERIRSGQYA